MNYGYVKVAAAVPRIKVADCKFNAGQIEKEIIIADGKGVQIIVFPELCITGYTCGDLFAQQLLLEEAEMGLIQILNNTRQMDIISIHPLVRYKCLRFFLTPDQNCVILARN